MYLIMLALAELSLNCGHFHGACVRPPRTAGTLGRLALVVSIYAVVSTMIRTAFCSKNDQLFSYHVRQSHDDVIRQYCVMMTS